MHKGTVDNLLKSSHSGSSGRPLNVLDFPRVDGQPPDSRLASDLYASRQMHRKIVNQDFPYPLQFMRWGLASTGHTTSHWHQDVVGFGTHIKVVAGCKIWFVVKFSQDQLDPCFLQTIDITKAINKGWEIEYVVLPAGSQL